MVTSLFANIELIWSNLDFKTKSPLTSLSLQTLQFTTRELLKNIVLLLSISFKIIIIIIIQDLKKSKMLVPKKSELKINCFVVLTYKG